MSNVKMRSFADASKQIQDNLNRHVQKYESTLQSDDDSDSDETDSDHLVDAVLQQYSKLDRESLQSLKTSLKSSLQSSSCLICIEALKKNDAIWNCSTCYVSLHISCIQKWSKDSIFILKQQQEEDPNKEIRLDWSCPNCRTTYEQNQIPNRYICFCGKENDPKFDPWLAPHSCGERCEKSLQPACKHKCILLCHPGPCPPCPQTVQVSCYCSKSSPTTKRCSASAWTCNTECGRLLSCGMHTCPNLCHPGSCALCSKTSIQTCCCEKAKEPRPCSSPSWKCGTKCGKLLACGFHSCDYICHIKGECPPCPLSLIRHCPCGKSDFSLPCTEATPTCGDSCGKLLGCGNHYCAERCHRGNCPSCLQMITKACRCGAKKKGVQCAKQFTCDVKCKKIRDCRKHPCNKKCCTGDCPSCEQMCGKTLNCKNHKCLSRCHQGPCYPCTKQSQIACSCGETKLTIPCGKEKSTKPPKCKKICSMKTDCHHAERLKHFCHPGPCPPCKQICQNKLTCEHLCSQPCHDNVHVKIEEKGRPAGPWEERGPHYQIKKLPCPPCTEPVPIPCLGQHEIVKMPCHEAKPMSCGRLCGRQLACTNHTCERDCHRVRHAESESSAGINCKKCESECTFPRPAECPHPCDRGCHSGLCKPCEVNIKMKCHCGLNNMFIKCSQLQASQDKSDLLCCKDQCPKLMVCGHRCLKLCHEGPCSSVTECKKKVRLNCPCKRKKEDFRCFNVNSKDNPVKCDGDCAELKEEILLSKRKGEAETKDEDVHSKREAEIFEKQQMDGGKRKRRSRRKETEEMEESLFSKYKMYIISASVLFAVIVGYSVSTVLDI